MSDIVERLREQAWRRTGSPKMEAPHAKTVEWEAADEIERLRADYERLWNDYHTEAGANSHLRHEIERLQEAKRAALKIADERSKENVELRAQLKTAVWADSEECKMLTAENEKLRAENAELRQGKV
jgi:hypothetical protein